MAKKEKSVPLAVLGNINGLPRELEFAIKVIPFLPLNGLYHKLCKTDCYRQLSNGGSVVQLLNGHINSSRIKWSK